MEKNGDWGISTMGARLGKAPAPVPRREWKKIFKDGDKIERCAERSPCAERCDRNEGLHLNECRERKLTKKGAPGAKSTGAGPTACETGGKRPRTHQPSPPATLNPPRRCRKLRRKVGRGHNAHRTCTAEDHHVCCPLHACAHTPRLPDLTLRLPVD